MMNSTEHLEPAAVSAAGPDTIPATGPDTGSRTKKLRFARLRKLLGSKLARLMLGGAAVVLVGGIVAFAMTRLLGPGQKFSTIELPYVQDFSDLDPKKWFLGNGIWALREEMLSQNANLNKPAAIYLPGKITAEQPYHFSTYVTLAKSTQQAGINFNAQYPDMTKRQHQVYLLRRPPDVTGGTNSDDTAPMELIAGYTDKDGKFIKQVSVPFGPDSGEYRLDLYVLGNTYTVQVNGQTLIDRRPLFYPNGLVGYHTLGPARFDTLKITTATIDAPAEQVYVSDFDQNPGGAGWVPFNGEWEITDGELVQANPAAQDAGIGFEGSAFEDYGLQVTFRHLTGAGGGLLFNMPSPYQLNGAHVVRYSDQADSVFWGFYDDQGLFTRQGFANVAPPGTETHQLRVFAGNASYDVYLDDQLLARTVPIQAVEGAMDPGRSGGHIGLITSLSSIAYKAVEVFPLLRNAAAIAQQSSGTPVVPASLPVINPTATTTPTETATSTATSTATDTATATSTSTVTTADTATATPTGTRTATKTPGLTPTETARAAAAPETPTPIQAVSSTTRPTGTAVSTVPTDVATDIATTVPTTTPAQTVQTTPEPQAVDNNTVLQGSAARWQGKFRGSMSSAGWRTIAGKWRFSNDSLVQGDPSGFDMAVAYAGSAFQNYSYSTTFRHLEGNGAGILFNLPSPDRLNGGYMVRYSDRRPGGIFWGYFDDSGKFVGQGYANVSPPSDVSHKLRVVSGDKSYDVYLDDFLLASDVPLQRNNGHIGMITVQTAAEYESAEISGEATAPAASQTPASVQPLTAPGVYSGTLGFPDQAVVSGKWKVDQGVYSQTVPDPADYILNTGLYAANYTIQSDVLLANKPELGGGVVLQAPERGRKAGATVVRFTGGGDGLFWGVYDEAGAFRGREAVNLPQKPEGETGYVLRVDVRGNTMDIYVDGDKVIENALLPAGQGWIGLVAYGGPVTFANVQVTVQQAQAAP